MAHKYVLDTDPSSSCSPPIPWDVFHWSLTTAAIPEMHDRLIVGTALHLQSLGHTVSLLTKDSLITQAKLVAVVW